MKALKRIILIEVSLVALYGCIATKEWYPLTTIDKQMIPYKMGDTIRFIDEKGALSLCTVDGDITARELSGESFSDILYEFRDVHLLSERGDLSFDLQVAAWRKHYDDYLTIYIAKQGAEFGINLDSNGNLGSYDSLEINGKTYRNVEIAKYSRGSNYTMQLYYNMAYGILRVTQDGEDIFTLVP